MTANVPSFSDDPVDGSVDSPVGFRFPQVVFRLSGDWISVRGDRITTETWQQVGPGTFEGLGRTFRRSDEETVEKEALRLVEMEGEIFYLAKVAHNALPIAFRLVDSRPDRMEFENPEHDFPRRITYIFDCESRMTVIVGDDDRNFKLEFVKQ